MLLMCILIVIISFELFLYWFRYTCLWILAQNSSANYALKVADTIRLSFPTVQQALRTEVQRPELDRLHQSLDHDCQVLTKLLNQAGGSYTLDAYPAAPSRTARRRAYLSVVLGGSGQWR